MELISILGNVVEYMIEKPEAHDLENAAQNFL